LKAKAVVKLKLPSRTYLEIFAKALEPEIKKPATTRSKASMEKRGKFLILTAEAKDTVALRATLNAYLRWINSIMNVIEFLELR
jgi:tRNA threonylcarbamoyladenosine modification (KEOPS) complex  Pcc1 subunit